jgi:hypothetical protein
MKTTGLLLFTLLLVSFFSITATASAAAVRVRPAYVRVAPIVPIRIVAPPVVVVPRTPVRTVLPPYGYRIPYRAYFR